jgi:hypothetical protein
VLLLSETVASAMYVPGVLEVNGFRNLTLPGKGNVRLGLELRP